MKEIDVLGVFSGTIGSDETLYEWFQLQSLRKINSQNPDSVMMCFQENVKIIIAGKGRRFVK